MKEFEAFFPDEEVEKTVFISKQQLTDLSVKSLYGRFWPDTRIYNVLPQSLVARGEKLCDILPAGSTPGDDDTLTAVIEDGSLAFYSDGKRLKVESYGLYQSIFSRNSGILETDVMREKRAVILGCGSVGSLCAMELARAGVGHFLLADPDIVEYHNVCRHQCGIEDVGDLKINALRRKLLNINPDVHIETFEGIVQNLPKVMMDAFCVSGLTIFIGCADNREADVYANRISIYYDASFLSIGFWERAYAGEIFYHIPSRGMPCYECALGNGGGISARALANHHVYSNQEQTEGLKFEPGISVDINFITTIGIKLIIDILNATNSDFQPRLLNLLTQYTLVCNISNPEIGGEMVEIFSYPLQVTTSLIVDYAKEVCRCNGQCRHEMEKK